MCENKKKVLINQALDFASFQVRHKTLEVKENYSTSLVTLDNIIDSSVGSNIHIKIKVQKTLITLRKMPPLNPISCLNNIEIFWAMLR